MSILGIGKSIKKRRKDLAVTQYQLAQLAEVSVNTLYKIERGQANPTLDTLDKIAHILGMELRMEVRKLELTGR